MKIKLSKFINHEYYVTIVGVTSLKQPSCTTVDEKPLFTCTSHTIEYSLYQEHAKLYRRLKNVSSREIFGSLYSTQRLQKY